MYTNDLPGFMGSKDLNYLYNKACGLRHGSIIVEIGSWCGKSTEAYVQASFDTKKDLQIYHYTISNNVYMDIIK